MRRAITIGFRHGSDTPVVVTGPEVPQSEHKAALKRLRASRANEEFGRLEIWSNAGAIGKRFLTPEQLGARTEASPTEHSRPKPKPKPTPKPKPAKS